MSLNCWGVPATFGSYDKEVRKQAGNPGTTFKWDTRALCGQMSMCEDRGQRERERKVGSKAKGMVTKEVHGRQH